MASPIFKNTLEKTQNLSKLFKHRAQLDLIARGSHRYPCVDQSYKQMINNNSKGEYFKEQRTKQIQIQNNVLLAKIEKIRAQRQKPNSYWLIDRSHSLNEIVKNKTLKEIDVENKRMLKKIIAQKPHISSQKLNKSSIEQERRSMNISKMEKYKMPQISSTQMMPQTDRSLQSVGSLGSINRRRLQQLKLDLDYKKGSIEKQKKG